MQSLNKRLTRKVEDRLKSIKCERDLVDWIVSIERDRVVLRHQLSNQMIQGGRNLRSVNKSISV